MNKKILILSRRDDRQNYDTSRSMVLRLKTSNPEGQYFAAFLEDLRFYYDGSSFSVTDTINNCDLKEYDAVFVMGWFKTRKTEDLALSAALYLDFHGKKVLNSELLHNRSKTKLSQLTQAALNGIKTTPFLAINDPTQLEKYMENTNFNFPVIVKSASASRGKNNYLVNSKEELVKAVNTIPKKIVLLQQFVPNEGDFRVIVMGDDVKLVIKRKSSGDSHLNNTSQGGLAEIVPLDQLDEKMLRDSVAISKLLRRDITGVDMIQHIETGEYFMLEVNNMPQLSTGSFVSEKAEALDKYLQQYVNE